MTDQPNRRYLRRKKLLAALSRNELDAMVGADNRPWNMEREALCAMILATWDEHTTEEAIAACRKAIT